MALTHLYDKHGLSISFKQAEENLGLKGVQLETLGFLQFRHCLEWGTFESNFKLRYNKYTKYQALNDRDLRQLKTNAIQEDNYDQIENFVEYERFLHRSYFPRVTSLLNRLCSIMKGSITNSDFSHDNYLNLKDGLS